MRHKSSALRRPCENVSAQVVPLLPRSTICRGTDLVKYAVTKGALTMASTAWMKDKDDRAVALVMQPMLEVKSV